MEQQRRDPYRSRVGKYRTRGEYDYVEDRDLIMIYDATGHRLAEAYRGEGDRIIIEKYRKRLPRDAEEWLVARARVALPPLKPTRAKKAKPHG